MSERTILVASDIELGAGGPTDAFPDDSVLAEIIDRRCGELDRSQPVDLVFNGDTFDFLRVPVASGFPAHITAEIACEKLDKIAAAHAGFFSIVREFLDSGERTVHFVVGNHDAELLFPDIQTRIAALCGVPSRVRFPGFELELGPVHIEHGSQRDPMFSMSPDQPFVEHEGRSILNLSWGALAALDMWALLERELYALVRIKPRERLFEVLPDARTLLLKRSWNYFGHDFWKDFRNDPLKHVTWTMIKEVTYRFFTADANVSIRKPYLEALLEAPAQVFVVGHEHRASRTEARGKVLVISGCLRNESILTPGSETLRPSDRGAVEVHLSGELVDEVLELSFPASMPPPGYLPDSLRDLQPVLSRYLAQLEDQSDQPS